MYASTIESAIVGITMAPTRARNSISKRFSIALALAALLCTGVVEARLPPVENIVDASIDGNPSLEAVKQAIVRAAEKRSWAVKRIGKGHMQAMQISRGLMAKVEIHFSRDKYSITYLDSEGLKYKEPGLIHKRYNTWVKNLNGDIQAELFSL